MKKAHGFMPIEQAIEELKAGRMLVVVDDEDRENEGDLLMASSKVRDEDVAFMAIHGRGLICQAITARRAAELDLGPMTEQNSASLGTAFTVSVDHCSSSTGISAADRAATVAALLDPATMPQDLLRPGHVFPLIARDGGVLERRGHTEAAVDLARLAGLPASGLICEIMDDDGTMARLPRLFELAEKWGLGLLCIADLADYLAEHPLPGQELYAQNCAADRAAAHTAYRTEDRPAGPARRLSMARMPTAHGEFMMYSYAGVPEAYALVMAKGAEVGRPHFGEEAALARVHSECLTGEALGSLRCDCGYQLQEALKRVAREGAGVLIYLRQEGRGIGLRNKIAAYQLQDGGLDTWDANTALHLPPDGRDYALAASIMKDLGISSCRLMTNNLDKIQGLEEAGIEVTRRIPLDGGGNPFNLGYLRSKRQRFGHLLSV